MLKMKCTSSTLRNKQSCLIRRRNLQNNKWEDKHSKMNLIKTMKREMTQDLTARLVVGEESDLIIPLTKALYCGKEIKGHHKLSGAHCLSRRLVMRNKRLRKEGHHR